LSTRQLSRQPLGGTKKRDYKLSKVFFHKQKFVSKLPAIVGLVYFVLSIPFVLGLAIPSLHEGNIYSIFYVILNGPMIYLIGGFADKVTSFLFQFPTGYQSNMVFMCLTFIFLVAISSLIGLLFDRYKIKGNNHAA
jgi:hypothetical protein